MKQRNVTDTWEIISKKVYWDRDVSLERWREGIATGHRSYFPDAVSIMSVAEFVYFYGADRFVDDWPTLRALLPEKIAKRSGAYDLVWSRLAGGGWNLKPVPDFNLMPERRRQFFVEVARSPGKNIYEVAKALGMQYRRAYDHAIKLIQEGKIRGADVVENGHRKKKLYPSYSQEIYRPLAPTGR